MKEEETMMDLPLGDRMKKYEKQFEDKIPYDNYIIVRCDGHKFSKYTKGMKKPYDTILSNSMVETTKDLVERFGAVTGYVQSDEITLIFAPQFKIKPEQSNTNGVISEQKVINEQIFGGRVQKMVSLIASFTTMRFNKVITDLFLEEMDKLIDKKESIYSHDTLVKMLSDKCGDAWFDARIYGVETPEEAFNSLMWRVRDCLKNSQSMFAQTYCSHKSLLNKNGVEQVEFCKAETGNDWEEISDGYKYGFLVKREEYQKKITVEELGFGDSGDTVTRTKTVVWSEKLTTFDEDKVDLITRRLKNG